MPCSRVLFGCRVLKPGGKSILVSFGVPDTRTDYLIQKSLKWKLQPIITLRKYPVLLWRVLNLACPSMHECINVLIVRLFIYRPINRTIYRPNVEPVPLLIDLLQRVISARLLCDICSSISRLAPYIFEKNHLQNLLSFPPVELSLE